MKKRWFFVFVALMIAVCLVATGCGEPEDVGVTEEPGEPAAEAEEEVITLIAQSAFPRGDIGGDALAYFAEVAAEYSDGTLQIDTFAEPEVVAMFEVPDALVEGLIDITQAHAGLWSGRGMYVGDVEFGLPYGYVIPEIPDFKGKAEEILRFFYEDGFLDILREEYAKQGIHWLGINTFGPVGHFNATEKAAKALQGTPDDLKGLVVRTDSTWMEWNHKVGMVGQDMAPGDAYTGLQTGTLDAHIWDVSAYLGMGFEEVAPYMVLGTENEHSLGNTVMSLAVWESLSPKQQDALTKAAEDYFFKTVDLYTEALEELQEKIDKGEIIQVHMSDENLELHRKTAYELWDEMGARDEASTKAVELFKKWRGVE